MQSNLKRRFPFKRFPVNVHVIFKTNLQIAKQAIKAASYSYPTYPSNKQHANRSDGTKVIVKYLTAY